MTENTRVRVGLVGSGGWARLRYIPDMLDQQDTTRVAAICEPSQTSYAAAAALFKAKSVDAPTHVTEFDRFIAEHAPKLDAVYISTPHKFHHDHAKACLEAGLDVLLEKPMTMTASEAQSLIDTRDRTGKHLVVAFQGSLSPSVRKAVDLMRSGEVGRLLSISATIWQGWHSVTIDAWRQNPVLAGGGFMFDTGAHMMNTVTDLAGEDFVEVAAWMDNRSAPVDINTVVMARLRSGAMVTMHASGATIPTCKSDIRVFCDKAILRTGAWGEFLQRQKQGRKSFRAVPVAPSKGPWEQFLRVRSGEIANPSPPEVGLRMAKLWDMIKASAAQNGASVRAEQVL